MLRPGEYAQPRAVAAWFVNHIDRDAGEAITHLKIQKLVYYSEAWFLANFDRPLTQYQYQAWAHGPVCRELYTEYAGVGYDSLPMEAERPLPETLIGFLGAIRKQYGQYSAKRLEEMTHVEDPWRITRGSLPPEARCDAVIDKLLMRNFYAAKIGKPATARI